MMGEIKGPLRRGSNLTSSKKVKEAWGTGVWAWREKGKENRDR